MANGINKRIRKRREELGITQRALAQMLNKTVGSVSSWENGRFKPWESLADLSRALNVSIDWLVTGKEFKPAATKKPESAKKKVGV